MTASSIWWVRRDLRLNDNPALSKALQSSDQVLPIFIIDPNLQRSQVHSEKRASFLFAGLSQLNNDLQMRGSHLTVYSGDSLEILEQICASSRVQAIIAEADYSPYAVQRDRRIKERLPLELVGGPAISPPGEVLKPDNTPYVIFSPYYKTWLSKISFHEKHVSILPDRMPTSINSQYPEVKDIPSVVLEIAFKPGEEEARRQLQAFTGGASPRIYQYQGMRQRLDYNGTSLLSPYLRFGMLSAHIAARAALVAIEEASGADSYQSAQGWLSELAWRDFYLQILYYFPRVRRENFRPFDIHWLNSQAEFNAWCEGQTGYPIIDASMRQLQSTGWMHNRARMIVASFLTKDLVIDWHWGERWFMQHLIDGDPAANNGGWQWSAGTGTDAAPYFRIFNPVTQSQKSDPNGTYIRSWVPELSRVPTVYIHEPWKMPLAAQKRVGCLIGNDYPAPIIDHDWARRRALSIYAQAKLE